MAFARKPKAAYRSGLEDKISGDLRSQGVPFEYEPFRIPYVGKPHTYTPDFVLANGIVVETKGYFEASDRTKHLLLQDQYPGLELRFVFTRSATKLSKTSKTTYADWCVKHGFQYADKSIPADWLIEPDHVGSLRIIKSLRKTK